MKLKVDDKGVAAVLDGKPVYVTDDGKEIAFDAPATVSTIARLNTESKGHRERAERAEGSLKNFEGIDDANAAREALKTVKNLSDKKLVDAGEVEKVKLEAIKAKEKEYEPVIKERDSLKARLHNEIIGGRFTRSKLIAEKMVVPADLVQSFFGQRFKLEEGDKVVGYHASGEKVFSRARPGEIADFDEALEIMLESYPQRDAIMKGTSKAGGGARPNGSGNGTGKTITRKEFEALGPVERAKSVADKVAVVDA